MVPGPMTPTPIAPLAEMSGLHPWPFSSTVPQRPSMSYSRGSREPKRIAFVSTSSVTPRWSVSGPLRNARFAPEARSTTARPGPQWSIAAWMRRVSSFVSSLSASVVSATGESSAVSTAHDAGRFGSTTFRVSCARATRRRQANERQR